MNTIGHNEFFNIICYIIFPSFFHHFLLSLLVTGVLLTFTIMPVDAA